MKTYDLLIVGKAAPHCFVSSDDGSESYFLEGSAFAWGDNSPGSRALAYEILCDLLGDTGRALKLYARFRMRVLKDLDKATDHTLKENNLLATVAEIEGIAKEMEPERRKIEKEKPKPVTDAAAPGQVWDSNPELKVNKV